MRSVCQLLCILVVCVNMPAVAQNAVRRQVAITVDDLPRGGDGGLLTFEAVRAINERLLRPIRDGRIPVTGFVNEGRHLEFGRDGLRQILDLWLEYGADLGNHSHSHLNINNVSLEQYTADIIKGEPVLRAALAARGRPLRYYRHPFLHTGPTPDIKAGMQAFLDRQGYQVAPVTLDNSDYIYAALYTRPQHRDRVRREYVPYMESVVAFFEARSVEVTGREFPQILLIHASELNADTMPELLQMFRRRGYEFVSLEQALADEVYQLPENYVGPTGFSWIHRWSMTKGMPGKAEPEPPAWVSEAWTPSLAPRPARQSKSEADAEDDPFASADERSGDRAEVGLADQPSQRGERGVRPFGGLRDPVNRPPDERAAAQREDQSGCPAARGNQGNCPQSPGSARCRQAAVGA